MRLAALALLAITTGFAQAEEISGPARALDSDVLGIGEERVLLFGMESVEPNQPCYIRGEAWQCHPAAMRALETLIDVGPATCTGERLPPFGRFLAVCTVAGVNVNEALVRAGFALARRDETLDYVAAEEAAKAEGIGIWQGEFALPSKWREDHSGERPRD